MKAFMKTTVMAAIALAMTTFGAAQARASGWPIAAAAVGGVAVGTAVGATIAANSQPVYYANPPAYYGPSTACVQAPAPIVVAAAPAYYVGPGFYGGWGYYHPYFRGGWGYGRGYGGHWGGGGHWRR